MSVDGAKEILAVSITRRLYTTMQLRDLESCRKYKQKYVCPPTQLRSTSVKTCEIALLQNLDVKQSCNIKLMNTFLPIFVKRQIGWIYSTPNPVKIVITCPRERNPTELQLEGTGTLEMKADCSARSENTVLPTSFNNLTSQTVVYKHFQINFEKELNFSLSKIAEKINDVDEEMQKTLMDQPKDMSDLLSQLENIERLTNNTHHTYIQWGWLTGLGLCLLVVVVVGFYRRRRGTTGSGPGNGSTTLELTERGRQEAPQKPPRLSAEEAYPESRQLEGGAVVTAPLPTDASNNTCRNTSLHVSTVRFPHSTSHYQPRHNLTSAEAE